MRTATFATPPPRDNKIPVAGYGCYTPPYREILATLGVTDLDLKSETVTVSTDGLLGLLSEAMRQIEVDEAWYIERYPDVHAAILAGAEKSGAAHFRAAGYREGRLPRMLPFDAKYYFDQYQDLAAAFNRDDSAALRYHYETQGYFEGRAGVPEHFVDAERWRGGLHDAG